jgi:hypothetical protein
MLSCGIYRHVVDTRFGGTSPPSSGSKNKPRRSQRESRWQADLLARLILQPWRWRRRLTFNNLHGVASQKIVPSITTAVRTAITTNIAIYSMFCVFVCNCFKLPIYWLCIVQTSWFASCGVFSSYVNYTIATT